MNICIDLTSLADNFSGIERYAACLAIEMIKDYTNSYILVFKNNIHPMFKLSMGQTNVEVIIIPECNKLLFNQIRLPNKIRKLKADYYLFLAFPVPVLLFKKNMISTIHDICCWDCPKTMNRLSKWYFRISHKIAIRKCKAIITISEFSKLRIIEFLHYDAKKIWLIYCGVDKKFLNYRKSNIRSQTIRKKYHLPDEYILSLSTLEPRKNLGLLIRAFTELVEKDKFKIPLVLAGRKGWKIDEELESIDQKVKDKIIFTNFIDDDDLPVIYGNTRLFVFPSMYEGFGMPPLEALACGASVLSSDSSSLPEVLGNNVSYFHSGDLVDLKRQLLEPDVYTKKTNIELKTFKWDDQAKILTKLLI